MTDYVITGLVKRRRELSGEIHATYKNLQKMIADLATLDATILQFDPNYKVDAIESDSVSPSEGLGATWRNDEGRSKGSASR